MKGEIYPFFVCIIHQLVGYPPRGNLKKIHILITKIKFDPFNTKLFQLFTSFIYSIINYKIMVFK